MLGVGLALGVCKPLAAITIINISIVYYILPLIVIVLVIV